MAGELSRPEYAARYGPTAGDRVRLGDTDLLALLERDESSYGDEVLRGWGEDPSHRDHDERRAAGRQRARPGRHNVMVVDPVLGVLKANIGVKDGVIVGIGQAGNPDVSDNLDLLSVPTPPRPLRGLSPPPAASTPTSTSSSPASYRPRWRPG